MINDEIVEISRDISSSEDKRLGTYFVKKSELDAKVFPEKVLKYLWDDAFKMDKEVVFDPKFDSLEDVIETYEDSADDKLKSVLQEGIYNKMLKSMNGGNEPIEENKGNS